MLHYFTKTLPVIIRAGRTAAASKTMKIIFRAYRLAVGMTFNDQHHIQTDDLIHI